MKTYLTTIFILFVHVIILQLAASLFVGMSATVGNDVPNVLMSMVVGLATVIALLKTQGLMMQLSYVSLGARSTRQLGTQFMNGVSYLGGRGKAAVSAVSSKVSSRSSSSTSAPTGAKRSNVSVVQYAAPKSKTSATTSTARNKVSTGTTSRAPKVNSSRSIVSMPQVTVRRVAANKTIKKEDKAV